MSMFATASFDPARSSTDRSHQRRDSTNRPQSLSELIEHIRQQRDSDPERAKEADRAVVTDDTDDGLDGLGPHGLERRKSSSSFSSTLSRKSTGKENVAMFSLSDEGPVKGGKSPVRTHRPLSALSPLQSFSPLQAINIPSREQPSRDQGRGHRREGSLTRSLSSKERFSASADSDTRQPGTSPGGLFSRLTLVKAPAVSEPEQGMRRRSKSSSSLAGIESLAPFGSLPGAAESVPTTARGPRRSFAASSFSSMTPLSASISTSPRHDAHAHADRYTGGIQRKTLSPEEIVDLAKSLNSPVADTKPSLQRRKSYGSSSSRRAQPEPEALEPVEYVQLDEETLLPFVDRPTEVAELMGHAQNRPLFEQLKAAFPKAPVRTNWQDLSPTEWSYDEFAQHLTVVDRVTCPDWAWVMRAREAVRDHSIALWERLGICLGCDADLLNAGTAIGELNWGGLGLGDLEDPKIQSQVWVEGLVAGDRTPELSATPTPLSAAPDLAELSDDEALDSLGGMETIGEDEDEQSKTASNSRQSSTGKRPTPAQVAGGRGPVIDPFGSPERTLASLHDERRPRSKSSVGLQIMTSPSLPHPGYHARSPSGYGSKGYIEHDRQIGDPLFPSSFSNIGLKPSLGRSASHVGTGPEMMPHAGAYGRSLGFDRKISGTGLSESAITFATESSYSGRD